MTTIRPICKFLQKLTVIIKLDLFKQCVEVNMNTVVIKILQASVVTEIVSGGLHRGVANFL